MSKNKYKYSSLKKKQGVIHKEKFTFDNSKVFLTGLIICFHIIPLLTAVISGASVGMYYLDPEQEAYLFYLFQTVVVMFCVYLILAVGFELIGAAIKRRIS